MPIVIEEDLLFQLLFTAHLRGVGTAQLTAEQKAAFMDWYVKEVKSDPAGYITGRLRLLERLKKEMKKLPSE